MTGADDSHQDARLYALDQSLKSADEWRATLIDAIESISEAFGLFDADDRLILCNQRYAQTFTNFSSFKDIEGITFAELVRSSVAKGEVIEPEFAGDIEAWVAERTRRHRQPGGSLRQIQLGDGTWLQISERPTSNGGIVGVRTDVTLLKRAQQAAEAANESKTRFLRNMSHEIRTPMNGVLGMAQLLAGTTLDDTQRHYVEAIEQSGRHLLRIINDILDVAKIESGLTELEAIPLDLVRLIEEASQMFAQPAQAKGLRLVSKIGLAPGLMVLGDPLRLQQIVINLLNNAIKFTETGAITIGLDGELIAGNQLAGTISVTDSGIGIAADQQERIFDQFAQADGSTARKFGGTGLGLTISRQLAQLMGGDITVTSRPGDGACFRVTIPFPLVTGAPRATEPAAKTPPSLPRFDGHVLLAEDNEVNKSIMLAWLGRLGLSVSHAANGCDALAQMKAGQFDMVLMDCQMPEMDGFAATQEIRRWEAIGDRRPTPIVALTAHAIAGDRETCLAAGMDDYLAKPFTGAQLAEVIGKWLRGGGRD